jgi:hypothetical protein
LTRASAPLSGNDRRAGPGTCQTDNRRARPPRITPKRRGVPQKPPVSRCVRLCHSGRAAPDDARRLAWIRESSIDTVPGLGTASPSRTPKLRMSVRQSAQLRDGEPKPRGRCRLVATAHRDGASTGIGGQGCSKPACAGPGTVPDRRPLGRGGSDQPKQSQGQREFSHGFHVSSDFRLRGPPASFACIHTVVFTSEN